MVVLNVYNGNVLGIQENLEYGIWFLVPLFGNFFLDKYSNQVITGEYMNFYIIWTLGVVSNLYWHFYTPFEENRSLRHRTEYYDTQSFLAAISFSELTRCLNIDTTYTEDDTKGDYCNNLADIGIPSPNREIFIDQ
jgi:hypothetical protein